MNFQSCYLVGLICTVEKYSLLSALLAKKAAFKKTGHTCSRCGHDDQNHLGIDPVGAVETRYPNARGCCAISIRAPGSS